MCLRRGKSAGNGVHKETPFRPPHILPWPVFASRSWAALASPSWAPIAVRPRLVRRDETRERPPLSACTATDGNMLRFGSRSAVSRSLLKVEHASPRRFRLVHIGPARRRLVSLCARAGHGQAARRGAGTQRAAARAATALHSRPSSTSRSGLPTAATGHHGASRKPGLTKRLDPQGCAGTADSDRPGDHNGFALCREARNSNASGELGRAAAPWHWVGRADLGKRTDTIGDVGTGALIAGTNVRTFGAW